MFAMGQNALRCAVAVGGRERNVVDDDTQIESGARAAESRKIYLVIYLVWPHQDEMDLSVR